MYHPQPEKAEGRETKKDSQGSYTLEACKAVKYCTKVIQARGCK